MFSNAAARHGSCHVFHLNALSVTKRAALSTSSTRPSLQSSSNALVGPSTPGDTRTFVKQALRTNSKPRSSAVESVGTDGALLPRYLRRQGLQEGGKMSKSDGDEDWKKPMDPYILAKRIRRICEEGKVDEAVTYLKNAPRDAMNTVVWNTMLWEALKVSRFQLAYSLYVDVSCASSLSRKIYSSDA